MGTVPGAAAPTRRGPSSDSGRGQVPGHGLRVAKQPRRSPRLPGGSCDLGAAGAEGRRGCCAASDSRPALRVPAGWCECARPVPAPQPRVPRRFHGSATAAPLAPASQSRGGGGRGRGRGRAGTGPRGRRHRAAPPSPQPADSPSSRRSPGGRRRPRPQRLRPGPPADPAAASCRPDFAPALRCSLLLAVFWFTINT
ncbi:Anoctamin-2 [Manis pentadactyla]|nr:Anoctamin-2 [Manis pentadactyla]